MVNARKAVRDFWEQERIVAKSIPNSYAPVIVLVYGKLLFLVRIEKEERCLILKR